MPTLNALASVSVVFISLCVSFLILQAKAVSEATTKNSKDTLAAERKNHKSLQRSLDEDSALLKSKEAEMDKGRGAYEELKSRREAAEKAVLAAQQHFQAVSAGLSSGAGGQEETLAAQKICECIGMRENSSAGERLNLLYLQFDFIPIIFLMVLCCKVILLKYTLMCVNLMSMST